MTEDVEQKPLDGLSEEEKTTIITNAAKEVHLSDILLCGKCNEVYYLLEEFEKHKQSDNCIENNEIKETLKEDKKPQIWAFTLWKNTKYKKTGPDDKAPTSWNIYQTWRAMKPPEKENWMTVATNMQGLFDIASNFERSKLKLMPKKEEEDVKDVKTPVILNKVGKSTNSRKAFRSGSDSKEEYTVEKLISKRYNPRKKTFEYLVKWETLDTEKNTWESSAALHNCKLMVTDFEKTLQAQREQNRVQKSLEKAKKAAERPAINEGRPQRTSKQKALNQVKAWCGAESQDHGDKRVFSDDSDDEDVYDKRIKLEGDSDSDDNQPVVTIKRVTKNGVERRVGSAQKVDTITLPENILIPDAKGIVRISQKQIPSLSSGVYVMSKTAGIIKLDTAAAAKLTQGGGQTVLKVAPKVGQASIKVIKKTAGEVSNGAGLKTGLKPMASRPLMKNYSGKVYMQRRSNTVQAAAAVAAAAKKSEAEFEIEMSKYDDESDGVEELEFPEEIQLPSADSPPPEFSLCPLTGKVVDKNGTVVETEETLIEEQEAKEAKTPAPSSSLGNLVNIAAADILEDLTNNALKDDAADMNSGTNVKEVAISIPQSVSSPPPLVPTAAPTVRAAAQAKQNLTTVTKPSILSTALTNANIVRRGPPKLVRRSDPQPRAAAGLVQTRTPPHQIVRQVGNAAVSRAGSTGQQVRQIRPGTTQVIRKRIVQTPRGQTQTVQRSVVRQPARVYQQVVKSSPQGTQVTYVATPTNSNKVITMPPLLETSVATPVVQKPIAPKITPPLQPPQHEIPTSSSTVGQDAATLNFGEGDSPLLITGEDGTIYQVAGQNEDGQTILITQGEDGEQQCLLVAPENAGLITQALVKPSQALQQQSAVIEEEQPQVPVDQQLAVNTVAGVEETTDDSQVVAQIVSANPPSPGGTRKVVLMLPDGNFMMTEVTAEQYAALELDK